MPRKEDRPKGGRARGGRDKFLKVQAFPSYSATSYGPSRIDNIFAALNLYFALVGKTIESEGGAK
jgi:hypothetical protein